MYLTRRKRTTSSESSAPARRHPLKVKRTKADEPQLKDTLRGEYDAEDSIRFYALRMREAGFVKSSPNNLITKHTDWRFLNELKKELKA